MTRVLVVEDEAEIREVIAEALVGEGYEVAAAGDGPSALQLVREQAPHVAILDLMMPELDGRGFLRECRVDPQCVTLQVIVLTAASPSKLDHLDVQAIVAKPFNLSELVDTVVSLAPA